MAWRALVSEEMRSLLSPADLDGLEVDWLPTKATLAGGDYDALVSLLVRKVTAADPAQVPRLRVLAHSPGADLAKFPRLRIVANCAVGYENIDVAECRRRNIPVTNTPDVLTEATADLTWALILAITRDLAGAEATLRAG